MKELSIKEEQDIQEEILEYVDYICKNENITYFLGFGTLLGAVRERGFIEWDDDIDILMKRSDFNKFAEVASKYSDERFFYQSCKTDPFFIVPELQRICRNGTFKWGAEYKNEKFHTGIYFDIFALDDGDSFQVVDLLKDRILKTIHLLIMKHANGAPKSTTLKGRIADIISKTMSISRWYRVYDLVTRFYIKRDKSKLVCYASNYTLKQNRYSSCDFNDVELLMFNGKERPCPKGYHNVLTRAYGDYMTPTKTKPGRTIAYKL